MTLTLLMKRILIFSLVIISPLVIYSVLNDNADQTSNQSITMNLYAKRYEFSINRITIPYGSNLTLILHSNDTIHGFYIEGYDLVQTICNEHYFTLSFIANKIGSFIYKCNEPACGPYHPYMVGILTVTPNKPLSFQFIIISVSFMTITAVFIGKWRKEVGNK